MVTSRTLHGQSPGHVPRRTLKRPVRAVRADDTIARPSKRSRRLSSVFSVPPSPEPAIDSPARGAADHALVAHRRRQYNGSQTSPTLDKNSGGLDLAIQHAVALLEAVGQVSVQGQLTADRQATTASQRSTAMEQTLEQRAAFEQESTMPRGVLRQPLMDWQSGTIKSKMRLSIKDLLRTPSPPSLPSVAGAKQRVLTDLVPRRRVVIKPSAVEERTAEPLSTDEYRPNLSPEPKAGRSPGPEHQPPAVHHTTTARLSASRQQMAANVQVVDQRVSNSFTSGQQTAIQPIASERANIPSGEEVVLSDSYIVSYIDNPMSIRGYAIQRSPSAPCSLPEWSSTQRLHTLDDGTDVYEDDDIVHIDLELEDQHSKFCPASLARIVDMRDLGCGDGDKGSGIISLVAWFNTRYDMQRYPQDWGCKNMSAWPKGKTHVLTTRLQLVEVGAVGRVLGPKERRRLEMGRVHDVLGSGRITEMTASLEWRFREAGPQQGQ